MITLAQLEREVARRTGPFIQSAQDSGSPTSSTATSAIMPSLKSNAILGGPENMWLLRRGDVLGLVPVEWTTDRGIWAGAAATYHAGDRVQYGMAYYVCLQTVNSTYPPPQDPASWTLSGLAVDPADRERMIQAFDSAAGRVLIDRNWRNPMQPNEMADLTHLHPTQELRVAVLAGLRRCFVEDRGRVYPNLAGGQVDLTSFQPWITSPQQVLRVQSGYATAGSDIPFTAVSQAGHVILASGASSSGVWLTVMRPVWSWVNGAESTTGPTHDNDELDVDLDYAAAAGHIEAWHSFPGRSFAAAAGNLQATQEMAAREFTRQALIWGPSADAGSYSFSEVMRLPL